MSFAKLTNLFCFAAVAALTAGAGAQPTNGTFREYCYDGQPVEIPTGGEGSADIVVPDSFPVGSVIVGLQVNHDYQGDLIFELTHNGMTRTILHRAGNGGGFSANNFGVPNPMDYEDLFYLDDSAADYYDAPPRGNTPTPGIADVTGSWRSYDSLGSGLTETLSDFVGTDAQGTWTLTVIDDVDKEDAGSINEFCLFFVDDEPGCDCYWDNGDALAKFDGQQSFINGYLYPDDPRGHEESRAADDFYLEKGYQYFGFSFEVSMITTFEPVPNTGDEYYDRIIVELYEDCDGRPTEEPFAVLTDDFAKIGLIDVPVPIDDVPGAYLSHWAVFVPVGDLCLEGNRQYWISAIGINEYFDEERRWYFAAAPDEPVRCAASVARDDIADTVLPDEWTPSPRINLHCQELAFCVSAEQCPIICDNGDFDYDGVPSIMDTTVPEARAADNFVLSPCHDYELCYIEGYVATNCDPWNAIAEIYTNRCNDIADDPAPCEGDTVHDFVGSWAPSNVIDTGETVELGGKVLRIYCIQFCPGVDSTAAFLPGNQNYWLSVVNRGTGSFNERGFTLFNKDCRRDCLIKISQARFRSPGAGYPDWTPVEEVSTMGPRDLAFRLGARVSETFPSAVTACWVDVNGDGVVNTLDVGAFLNAYGQGCVGQ